MSARSFMMPKGCSWRRGTDWKWHGPKWPISLSNVSSPKNPTVFLGSTTSWGSKGQAHEPRGAISHLNYRNVSMMYHSDISILSLLCFIWGMGLSAIIWSYRITMLKWLCSLCSLPLRCQILLFRSSVSLFSISLKNSAIIFHITAQCDFLDI